MIKADYHTHTIYCDGRDTPADMARAAYEKGMDCLGFSGHGYTPGDKSYCVTPEGFIRYKDEVNKLKEEYAGRMDIYLGLEWDLYTECDREGLEYLIVSVHYIEKNGRLFAVDESPEAFKKIACEIYGGDYYAFAEEYYRQEARVLEVTGADIVGHFDLFTKFNEGNALFDTSHPRYRDAWRMAADELLKYDRPFEINTGAMSRGYRSSPYPSREITEYIGEHGGSFILSSDSHRKETLMFGFENIRAYIEKKGYRLVERPV